MTGTAWPGLSAVAGTEGPGVKRYFAGTHRVVDPAGTVERWRPEMRRFGITRLADVTHLDVVGIPVVQAIRPNSRTLSVAQGKGATTAAAMASALMEAAEFWHAEHHHLPLRRADPASLRDQARVLDLDRMPRRAGATLAERERILWVQGTDLATAEPVWAPEALVGLDHAAPRDAVVDCFLISSGGLASGNTRLEAIAHALFELVERDAWALHTVTIRNGKPRRVIDLRTVDAANAELVERCRRAGVGVVAWDMTTDLGLPVVGAATFDDPPNPFRHLPVTTGMGCHASAAVALARAVTEAAQSRLTVIAGSRDDLGPSLYTGRSAPEALAAREGFRQAPARVAFGDLPDLAAPTVAADVALALDRLAGRGLRDVVVVDLTHDGIGLPVVRVLVPGLADRTERPWADKLGERTLALAR